MTLSPYGQVVRTLGQRCIDAKGLPGRQSMIGQQAVSRCWGEVMARGKCVGCFEGIWRICGTLLEEVRSSAERLTRWATVVSEDEVSNLGHPERAYLDVTWSNQINSGARLSPQRKVYQKKHKENKKQKNLEQPEVSYLEVSWSSNNSTKAEDWCFLDGFRKRTPSPPRSDSFSITNAKETNYLARLFQYSDSFFILVWLYIARYY